MRNSSSTLSYLDASLGLPIDWRLFTLLQCQTCFSIFIYFSLSWMLKFKVNIVLLNLTLGSQWANGASLLAKRKRERGRNSGGECVCSCSLVCLVQNWFKAPGHRKKATLHSRHVPETSSGGSTIAIQQRRLQTPKWVCSVLQWPTWQSATYSTSLAPNMPPPSRCYFSILSSSSPFSFSASFRLTSPPSDSKCFSLPHSARVSRHPVHFIFVTFSLRSQSIKGR